MEENCKALFRIMAERRRYKIVGKLLLNFPQVNVMPHRETVAGAGFCWKVLLVMEYAKSFI